MNTRDSPQRFLKQDVTQLFCSCMKLGTLFTLLFFSLSKKICIVISHDAKPKDDNRGFGTKAGKSLSPFQGQGSFYCFLSGTGRRA